MSKFKPEPGCFDCGNEAVIVHPTQENQKVCSSCNEFHKTQSHESEPTREGLVNTIDGWQWQNADGEISSLN